MTTLGVWTLAALTLVATPLTQAPPQRQAAPAQPIGRGIISGALTTADTGAPARRATVRLVRVSPALTKTATSDSEGRFTFSDLPPGEYRLSATKPGYLDMVYGARQPGPTSPGTTISLAENQRIEKLVWTMPRGGVITGIVTDEFGDPSFNTPVRALRFSYRNGERIAGQAAISNTDDRGVYRLAGLLPGEYLVNAVPRDSVSTLAAQANAERQMRAQMTAQAKSMPEGPAAAEMRDRVARMTAAPPPAPVASAGYVPVFYPGSTMPSGATVVSIGVGEERTGVDFPLQAIDTATIAGTVVNAEGPLNDDTRVQLIDPALPVPSVGVWFRNTEPDGKFSFQGVSPGNYVLKAYSMLPLAEGGAVVTAAMNVSVGAGATSDVTLTLRGSVPVSGRLSLEGLPPADTAKARLVMRQIQTSADWESPPPRVTLKPDGSFSVENVAPGRYRFAVMGLPDGWTINSAMFGGVETADVHLTVEREGKYADGELTVTNRVAEVTGTLTTVANDAAAGYTVILFPTDRAMWLPESRRIQAALSGRDGRYTFKGLPAGDYRVAAVASPEPGREFDPVWLSELFAVSSTVRLAAGEARTQNLTVR